MTRICFLVSIMLLCSYCIHASETCVANTRYSGEQSILCEYENGFYLLKDMDRGIVTLNGESNPYRIVYSGLEGCENPHDYMAQEYFNLIQSLSPFANTSIYWDAPLSVKLTKYIVKSVTQDNSWYILGEGAADVYIKIKDRNGTVLYRSNYYNDPTFPVVFSFTPILLTSLPYTIELWDYDPIGGDDLIKTSTISTLYGTSWMELSDTFENLSGLAEIEMSIERSGFQHALDAHWGMEKTIDFFRNEFGRNSYDNNGATIYQIINQPNDGLLFDSDIYATQYVLEPYFIYYGIGVKTALELPNVIQVNPLVTIDLVASSFTQLLIANNSKGGLEMRGETAALRNGFCNIMGLAVKQYATNQNNWLIGDQIYEVYSNKYSIIDPHNSLDGNNPQPKNYRGQYWIDSSDSESGNYVGTINSGVIDYWFYLLSEGGTGINELNNSYEVRGIGFDKSVNLVYNCWMEDLSPQATFIDARNATIDRAIQLYGNNSAEHRAVANAWHAVGVGESYDISTTNNEEISLKMFYQISQNQISIELEHPQIVGIYNINGDCISAKKNTQKLAVRLPSGVYILRIGEKYDKVIIK